MELNKDTHIMIVGLGLLGGAYASGLSKNGHKVRGIARRQETIDYAKNNGYIEEGYLEPTKENLHWADIVILCLYPSILLDWVDKYNMLFKDGTLITDVTGIKQCIVDKVQNTFDGRCEFIPSHPMAGRERSGIENSTTEMFKNANFIITPTEKNTENGIEICKQIGIELGFARIAQISPKRHDEMIAFLSQLTHILAVSLMTAVFDDDLCEFTGDSFRDLTRIARLNDEMWSELFLLNKEALLMEMNKFEIQFNKMKEYLIVEDRESMREMMRKSTERRALFDERNLRK